MVTAIWFHVVTALPGAPWAAGVVVQAAEHERCSGDGADQDSLGFHRVPFSSDEGATCPHPGLRVVSILTSQGLSGSRLQ